MFGYMRRRAGPTGGIKHEVTGVGAHQHAALNDLTSRLHHVNFVDAAALLDVLPKIRHRYCWEIIDIADVPKVVSSDGYPVGQEEASHTLFARLPPSLHGRPEGLAVDLYGKPRCGALTLCSAL